MSGAQQHQDSVPCTLFGERLLLPQDTAVEVSVEAFDPRPRSRSGGKAVLVYTVGMRFAISHASLVARTKTFTERADRLRIEVRTRCPYDSDRRKQFFREEVSYVTPILQEMEDMALKSYYEGEVSFDVLRDYFTTEYLRRQGARPQRKSQRH